MTSTAAPTDTVEIFVSSSREDETWRSKLMKQLISLERSGRIRIWHDSQIKAGEAREREITTHLDNAQIILLLVSPSFLASDACYNQARQAMKRQGAEEVHVLPVILHPCDWSTTPFAELQSLPAKNMAVSSCPDKGAALADVARGIRLVVERIQEHHVPHPPMIPRRNHHFTDREELLAHLYKMFHDGKGATPYVQAISGLPGLGKTQLAIEYAHRHFEDYKKILWASADTRETLVSGFVNIASFLKLPEKNARDQNHAVNAVQYWLTQNKDWLLIIDNADDLDLLKDFIPSVGRGHILLTTHEQATRKIAQQIDMQKMELDDGALFLLRRAGLLTHNVSLEAAAQDDIAQARKIVEVMGGLPLALEQAGAYIEGTRCRLSDYLQYYQSHPTELLELVTKAFSLLFEKVQQTNPAAAELLRFCAFLHPDTIPRRVIIEEASELGRSLRRIAADQFELDKAIRELIKYSLVSGDPKMGTLTIHRLVQDIIKHGMDRRTQRLWAERTVRAVNRAFPDVELHTWEQCEDCLPHAQACLSHIKKWDMRTREAIRLLEQTASYLQARAQYTQAGPFYQQAMLIQEQALGAKDPTKVADMLRHLGWLHYKLDEYTLSEASYTQAQEIYETALGPESPKVADILNKRGLIYYNRGEFDQAERLYERALTIAEKTLNPQHPDIASILNNLGWLYYNHAKYPQAERLYQRALTIRRQVFEEVHPDVAETLNALAMLYRSTGNSTGNYTRAEQLFLQALAMRERTLGKEHPDVAITLNDLAWLYRTQGRYTEAEQLYRRALEIRKKTLGLRHRHVATVLNDLALLYVDLGRYAEAEPLFQQALEIREQTVGQEHHRLAATLNNLAWLLYNQGKYAPAEQMHKRALQIREKALGIDQPQPYIAQSLNGLGEVYRALGYYRLAEDHHKRALQIREKVFGQEHRHVAMSLNNTAKLYTDKGRYTKAEQFYERARAIWENVFGRSHPNLAQSLNGLAEVAVFQGCYTRAEELYQQALAIYEQAVGREHPYVAQSLNGLGWLYVHVEKYAMAKEELERALHIREHVLGPEHPEVATTLSNQAWLHYHQGNYDAAKPLYTRVLSIRERLLGQEHPHVAQTLSDMGALCFAQEGYIQAKTFYEKAFTIRKKKLGERHPLVAQSLYHLAEIYRRTDNDPRNPEAFYQEALSICKQWLRKDHPYLVVILKGYAELLHDTRHETEAEKLEKEADAIRAKSESDCPH